MNTPNNKKRKESQEKIEKVFIELIQSKEIEDICVTDICKQAKLNRSTFYANYLDIYDLANKMKDKLFSEVNNIFADERTNKYNSNDFLKLFKHIKDNQLFYKTYFKLNFDNNLGITEFDTNLADKYYNNEFIDFHIEFFKAGLNAVIKKWLNNGCQETPEEIRAIIESEYKNK